MIRRVKALLARLRPAPEAGRVIAICHCHHADLVPELAGTLRKLPPRAEIHVTSSEAAVLALWASVDGLPTPPRLHAIENRGRDLRPFFDVARGLAIDPDALILKLHGKRSDYTRQGRSWRRDLLEGLLPSRRTAGLVARRFREDPRLGILGAPRSFISHPVYWGDNRAIIGRLMPEWVGAPAAEDDLGFFAGSMFWMRGAVLTRLLPLVDLEAFEPEPLRRDGSYAHALERVLVMAAMRMGWAVGEIGDPRHLDPATTRERKLPYL